MDSDKTTGPCGLSGSSQCPRLLIKGLRKFPPSGGTQTTKRRGSLQELAARPARVARLDDARRVGAAQPFACPNFHPGPTQASPGQPFRFVGHLRSARWAPACPITIRCLGLAPQAEQIADVLTPAYQAAPCIHTPLPQTPSFTMTAAIDPQALTPCSNTTMSFPPSYFLASQAWHQGVNGLGLDCSSKKLPHGRWASFRPPGEHHVKVFSTGRCG